MKKLSKEKRKQLVLVSLVIGMVILGLWFGLIGFLNDRLETVVKRRDNARQKYEQVRSGIANAGKLEVEVAEAAARLARLEDTMATGDLYSWVINTIRQFKLGHKIDIPQFSQIDGPKDTTLLPNFPYKQATLTIGGSAYFHDFGRFLADFENKFPYIRVQNLSLEPTPALAGSDREKLTFRMDIIALVKPSGGA